MTQIMSLDVPVTPPAVAPAARPRGFLARLLRKNGWGLADQLLISGTNFVTMVLLARGLGPAAFGAFNLVYGGMLFANSLQGALIVQPHSVLSASRHGRAYADYTTATAASQLAFAGLAALLALLGGMVSWIAGWPATHLLLALAPCAVAWQLQEFVRRVLYDECRLGAAFANDVISYGGQTVAIAALWRAGVLTAPTTLYAIMATSAAGVALGAWQVRASLAGRFGWSALRDNWHFGKWLAGAEVGYWLSSQTYGYLAALMLGTAATGVLKAAYVVFGPVRILGFFLKTVFPNRFARTLVEEGKAGLNRQVRLAYLMAAPVIGGYCALVVLLSGPLVRLLYGEAYTGHSSVLVLYAVFAFVAFMAQIVGSALRAGHLTRRVFASQAWASAFSLPLGWVVIKVLGVEGAVVGMILTSLVVNASNWRAYLRDLGHGRGGNTADGPDGEAPTRSLGDARGCAAQQPPELQPT